jgi:hypothetical protein
MVLRQNVNVYGPRLDRVRVQSLMGRASGTFPVRGMGHRGVGSRRLGRGRIQAVRIRGMGVMSVTTTRGLANYYSRENVEENVRGMNVVRYR